MRIIAALLFAVVLAEPALAERRVALVVGNDSYDEVTGLKKAVSDAHALADALKPLGFEVDVVDNASRSTLSRHMVDFERRVQPGDTALFFFAGHGVEIRGENYLLPTDVPNAGEGREGLVRDSAFSANDIIARIQSRGAGRVIAVLDACRNSPFEPSLGTRALGGGSSGLAGMEASEGVFVLLSAGAKQEALDTLGESDGSPNSIFTRALIKSLSTPGLSLVQIAKQTQTEVSTLAAEVSHEQMPAYSDKISGDFVLLPAAPVAPAGPAATTGGTASADVAAWKKIEASRSADDFVAYLDQFGPSAIFAEVARQRVAALTLVSEPPAARDQGGEALTAALSEDPPKKPAPTDPGTGNPASPEVALADSAGDEIVFATGGARVATYGDDPDGSGKRIRIWASDGTLLSTLTPELGHIEDARFSANGSRLAVADHDRVIVWDTASAEQVVALNRLKEADGGFSSVAFSNDGSRIATGNGDGRVRFWNAETGLLLETLDGPRLSGSSAFRSNLVGFDPDGAIFVSAQGDGELKIRLWKLSTGKVLRDLELPRCEEDCNVRGIRFYDGLIVASVSTDDVFVLDPASGRTVGHFNGRLVLLARNGQNPAALIASGKAIRIYDLVTGALIQEVEAPELSSARLDIDLKLGARRSPDDGSWLVFPANTDATAAR